MAMMQQEVLEPYAEPAPAIMDPYGAPEETPFASLTSMKPGHHSTAAHAPAHGAAAFNQKHASDVATFQQFVPELAGELDVEAVKAWQAAHGLAADGKIGPKTVQAAMMADADKHPVLDDKTAASMRAQAPAAAPLDPYAGAQSPINPYPLHIGLDD
jgi:hypothetical protein